ncbi:kynurenine/alpha-aminoadipate aminotransferase, mitochondrial-like [Neocloeon triangulifer]|uniref:kynurenine/alpha-aminoadipate aminotransferase, mitochondrial-like n=1 Tax=Neocloeon triangulifer TaxID=2078957 RepID=UPI00286EFA32|nr:kynurenine/alpha-aminoadipate aminotransferase, mitochondrial-like [Neocloeon triangulifer]XP_059483649.1 kynurenine/alpha-aminoadipate aminotransferase, mitochondrial-like [Neocloeon triangulifer]XP_059483650.1 kynurenine/alpha-aminoadipate aminotransferase, mitochondrial-like [Neocloeon triangulifer]
MLINSLNRCWLLATVARRFSSANLKSVSMQKINYDRFVNALSARRKPSPIRELTKLYASAPAGTIFLAGGIPNGSTFPFSQMTVELKDGSSLKISGKTMENALQYQPTPGYPALIHQLKKFQSEVHKLKELFWMKNDLLVSTGSQDALCKALEMSLEEGDPILVQEPIYPGTSAIIRPLNAKMVPIAQDEEGIIPSALEDVLSTFGTAEEVSAKSNGVPKLLYLNSTGANPTGATISTLRKKEIYKIVCEYNLVIMEDDPYYFLHFEEQDPVSFLSMDVEGRVLRFDSFSKILSSGLRIGFVTGPKDLVHRIELHTQASTMHTSAFSQVVVSTLLEEWGSAKLQQHFKSIQKFYKDKRDCMLAAADKHLKGLAEWNVPKAGMFLWIRVPGIADTKKLITEGGILHGVILVPGKDFLCTDDAKSQYFRASYTVASPQDIDKGFERLANLIREENK